MAVPSDTNLLIMISLPLIFIIISIYLVSYFPNIHIDSIFYIDILRFLVIGVAMPLIFEKGVKIIISICTLYAHLLFDAIHCIG